jgi:amino acid transporter
MRGTRARWFALGLSAAGIGVLVIVATSEVHGGAFLSVAVGAAIFVLLLPVAAYFIFRRSRPADER